jgi:hypothetical protein
MPTPAILPVLGLSRYDRCGKHRRDSKRSKDDRNLVHNFLHKKRSPLRYATIAFRIPNGFNFFLAGPPVTAAHHAADLLRLDLRLFAGPGIPLID